MNLLYSYDATLKLTQFFCFLSYSDKLLLLHTSSLNKDTNICMSELNFQYSILMCSWYLVAFSLVVSRCFWKVPCIVRDVNGKINLWSYCIKFSILHHWQHSGYHSSYSWWRQPSKPYIFVDIYHQEDSWFYFCNWIICVNFLLIMLCNYVA